MTHCDSRLTRAVRDESGMALLIAVIVLLLMSALGLSALQHAGNEASGSGTSRRKDGTLYAAESGLKLVQRRMIDNYSSYGAPNVVVDEAGLIEDGFGNNIHVVSGAPVNGTIPSPAVAVGPTSSRTTYANGYQIGATGHAFRVFPVDVTALDVGNGMVHLQSQFRAHEGSGGGMH